MADFDGTNARRRRTAMAALAAGLLAACASTALSPPQPMPETDQASMDAAGVSQQAECGATIGAPTLGQGPIDRAFFPPAALNNGIQGWAYVKFDVELNGSTANHSVVYSEPSEVFDLASVAVVQAWTFPVRSERCAGVVRRVTFRLPG